MARRAKGRPLNGVLLLNKSRGMTSNSALQKARRLFDAAKAGHTGSLDPLATGVLPICFGESTKFSQYLLDADKRYQSEFCLGVTTTTGDAEGDELATNDASHLTEADVIEALKQFRGEIEQTPSMFSALKHQGQPLYKLARQGKTIERPSRTVTIHNIALLDFEAGNPAKMTVDVHCSKGTYIRSIAEDLGQALGCGAHVKTLHRSLSGSFSDDHAMTLDQLAEELKASTLNSSDSLDHHLLPVDAPIQHLPQIHLPEAAINEFRRGIKVEIAEAYRIGEEGVIVRVFSDSECFVGIGELQADNQLAPKRLIAEDSQSINK